MKFENELPKISWIKNDPEKHKFFEDGFRFLGALQVKNSVKKTVRWEFDVLTVRCDGDWMILETGGGEIYDSWGFEDFEYFHILDGREPTPDEDGLVAPVADGRKE